jgi:HAD superfamily 5'-nucleotidase-like hydrolase
MTVFVNRVLNMKKIQAIGFDMDYTLVRYHTKHFEEMTHHEVLKRLVELKSYPEEITKLKFDFDLIIEGLVLDRQRGNILQLNRYGKVKISHHGTRPMPFKEQKAIYANRSIDLGEQHVQALDTSFAVSNGVLFSQLVDMKDSGADLPDYEVMSYDIKEVLDICHADGTLKNQVREDLEKYIISEPEVAQQLEKYKAYGKRLFVATNSDYAYTKLLLDYTITPHLKDHKCWSELFEVTVTLTCKPRFFLDTNAFLKVDPKTGSMSNWNGKVEPGIYQGGSALKLQNDMGLEEDHILYMGDHIYGDVVSLKKSVNWRTALILEPLATEVDAIKKSSPVQLKIDGLMEQKEICEIEINKLDSKKYQNNEEVSKEEYNKLFSTIENINSQISDCIDKYNSHFNSYWGQAMRAGQEESRFADQVEKYACIYMSKVSDLLEYSPRTYFRPQKRFQQHEKLTIS